jgi:hypothetical protein
MDMTSLTAVTAESTWTRIGEFSAGGILIAAAIYGLVKG